MKIEVNFSDLDELLSVLNDIKNILNNLEFLTGLDAWDAKQKARKNSIYGKSEVGR